MEDRPVKRNGFYKPFHSFQIIAWGITAYHVFASLFWLIPLLPLEQQVTFTWLYMPTQIAVIVLAYIATKSDPTDPITIMWKSLNENRIYYNELSFNARCRTCQVYSSKFSKHCQRWNRCVDNFDHHWKWLNNCIGQMNYIWFILLIVILEINAIILVIFSLLFIIDYFQDQDQLQEILQSVYGTNDSVPFLVFIIILLFFAIWVGVAMANLIGLHVFLKLRGMTTYEYIVYSREKANDKAKRTAKVISNPAESRYSIDGLDEESSYKSDDEMDKILRKVGISVSEPATNRSPL